MTNKELQSKLDQQKWEESKAAKLDLSGKMPYCEKCEHRYRMDCTKQYFCTIFHSERVANCACAKAQRKIEKEQKSKK